MRSIENIDWSPDNYQNVNFIAEVAGTELLERLSYLSCRPTTILDVACGCSKLSEGLLARYQPTSIVALDKNRMMLQDHPSLQSIHAVQADATLLPLLPKTIDLLVANLVLPWMSDITATFKAWQRVLRADGILMFSALGPDTLLNWQPVMKTADQPIFRDMHDIGDLLLNLGFLDPVLDVEHVMVSYDSHDKLIQELIATGMWFPSASDDRARLKEIPPSLELHYEIIYGHAFAPAFQEKKANPTFSIPLSQVRSELQKK